MSTARTLIECPNCAGRTFAIVDELKPDGSFGPGPERRCINCKAILPPDAISPDRERVARIIDPLGYQLVDELERTRLLPAQAERPAAELVAEAETNAASRTAVALAKADQILALTAADPIPIEREGFVLVPRTATALMETAGAEMMSETEGFGPAQQAGLIWNGMVFAALSAAPVLSEGLWFEQARDQPELVQNAAAIMDNIEEVEGWSDNVLLVTARAHAYVLFHDLPDALPAPPAKPSEGTK